MIPLTRSSNAVNCIKGSFDKTQYYIGWIKRHLAVRVQDILCGKLVKSVSHELISSCMDCHTCSINNLYSLAQANSHLEAKIKEALYIKRVDLN